MSIIVAFIGTEPNNGRVLLERVFLLDPGDNSVIILIHIDPIKSIKFKNALSLKIIGSISLKKCFDTTNRMEHPNLTQLRHLAPLQVWPRWPLPQGHFAEQTTCDVHNKMRWKHFLEIEIR